MTDTAISELKEAVYAANLDLVKAGLVVLTWGNASEVDRERGIVAIKPSGVAYDSLTPDDIVLVSLETGQKLPGQHLCPSSDTATHVYLYRLFEAIGGIAHTHSRNATSWAQAGRAIPCYGTTHADTFRGEIPLVPSLRREEIETAYELNTGAAIVEHFKSHQISPVHTPGALLAHHAPFAWGRNAAEAVEHAIILEEVAALALITESLKANASLIPNELAEKHFQRKHGVNAYYGQIAEVKH